jgi:hypothetical protein
VDLGWRADGIERAEANGGVTLERYRRPGFTGGPAVRALGPNLSGGAGLSVDVDPDPGTVWDRRPARHHQDPCASKSPS